MLCLCSVNRTEAEELEKKTRGQSESADWKTERSRRLTASKFAAVFKHQSDTSRHNTVQAILNPRDISKVKAVKHGRESEPLARAMLQSLPGVGKVRECGLFVDTRSGYLAASPDGVLEDDNEVTRTMIFLTII